MKQKKIFFIHDKKRGYYIKKGKYSDDISKAKRYKTFNGVFKLYNELLDTEYSNDIKIEYEVYKTRKVGRILHEKIDYMGQYDLTEYFNKIKEQEEIDNHKVVITNKLNKNIETNISTKDDFWKE